MTGFTINAVVMVGSGVLGLLLLWPNTERARLMARRPRSRNAEGAGRQRGATLRPWCPGGHMSAAQ